MVTKEEMDLMWNQFRMVVNGFIPSQEEKIARAWAEMAKTSSQKRLMLQKQHNLRARMRAIGGES